MFRNITFVSIILLTAGIGLIGYGIWYFVKFRNVTWSGGIVLFGFGILSFAATNGFADMHPRMRIVIKLGIVALILGVIGVAIELFQVL